MIRRTLSQTHGWPTTSAASSSGSSMLGSIRNDFASVSIYLVSLLITRVTVGTPKQKLIAFLHHLIALMSALRSSQMSIRSAKPSSASHVAMSIASTSVSSRSPRFEPRITRRCTRGCQNGRYASSNRHRSPRISYGSCSDRSRADRSVIR